MNIRSYFNKQSIVLGSITLILGLLIGFAVDGHGDRGYGSGYRYMNKMKGMDHRIGPVSEDMETKMGAGMPGMHGPEMPMPPEMSMQQMMDGMSAGLAGKTSDTFDQAFLSEMIVHHQGAVKMAELALKNAKHQEIKDLASAIIKAQNSEISSMQAWLKSWYQK